MLIKVLNYQKCNTEVSKIDCIELIGFLEFAEDERIRMEQTKSPSTAEEVLTYLNMFFLFVRTGDQFGYWWKFFKSRLAPILYPHECQSLELLNKLDGNQYVKIITHQSVDMGFRQPYTCPAEIHLLVLATILESLETSKKSEVLYATDKDIYLMLLIFRQSFLLPPKYFEHTQKMLKTYRSWICKDFFLYTWPAIMERSRNIYYRVGILSLDIYFIRCLLII